MAHITVIKREVAHCDKKIGHPGVVHSSADIIIFIQAENTREVKQSLSKDSGIESNITSSVNKLSSQRAAHRRSSDSDESYYKCEIYTT